MPPKKIPNKHLVSVRGEGHNEKGDPSKHQGLAPHYPMTIMTYNDNHYDDNEIITLKRSAGVCKRRGETQGGVRAGPPIIPWQLFCFHRSSDPPPPLSPIFRPTAQRPTPTPQPAILKKKNAACPIPDLFNVSLKVK